VKYACSSNVSSSCVLTPADDEGFQYFVQSRTIRCARKPRGTVKRAPSPQARVIFAGAAVHQVGNQSSWEKRKLIPSIVCEFFSRNFGRSSQKRSRNRSVTRITFPISILRIASCLLVGNSGINESRPYRQPALQHAEWNSDEHARSSKPCNSIWAVRGYFQRGRDAIEYSRQPYFSDSDAAVLQPMFERFRSNPYTHARHERRGPLQFALRRAFPAPASSHLPKAGSAALNPVT